MNVLCRKLCLMLFLILTISGQAWAMCTRPDGVEGEIIYNKDQKVAQYCDGEKWIGVGWRRSHFAWAAGGAGQIQFNDGNGQLAGDVGFVWNNDNKRLGVGAQAPETAIDVSSTEARNAEIMVTRYSTGGQPPRLRLRQAEAQNQASQAGARLGTIAFHGHDGDNFSAGTDPAAEAGISASLVGDGGSATQMGTRLAFRVKNNGDTSNSIRMVIEPNGFIGMGTSATPLATLDIHGWAKLALNSSQPVACDTSRRGSVAMTSAGRMCVCDSSNSWREVNTATACAW